MPKLSDNQLAVRHYDVANECLRRSQKLQVAADEELAKARRHQHKAEMLTRPSRVARLG